MAGIADFLKEIAIEVGAELFSINTMKKFITKTMAQKVGNTITGTTTQTPESQDVDIKAGGVFNLSDEEAYAVLMAKLETSSDKNNQKLAFKVSKGVNNELPLEDQKQRFRVVFGRLSQIEYTKETERQREEIPQAKGEPKIKEKVKEVKINLAIECLKSFVNYTPKERLEVYKAMGIFESELQRKSKSAKKLLVDNECKIVNALNSISSNIAGEEYLGLWAETKKTLWPFGKK
jgi:hypothetical protein